MINIEQTSALAAHLATAESQGRGVKPLTEINPELSIRNAYDIQLKTIEQKVNAGQKVIGKKIGLTSLGMQELLGEDQPYYGHLLDGMVVNNGGTIASGQLLQPRVGAHFAFALKKELVGPRVTAMDVLQATDYILPALEVVDSRISDWEVKLQDKIADNASCGLFVLGDRGLKVTELDLVLSGMVLYKNDAIVRTGVGAAALGNPAACVAWLANKLFEFGITLKAGEVILSGALSTAENAQPGDTFNARFAHLGQVSVHFRVGTKEAPL